MNQVKPFRLTYILKTLKEKLQSELVEIEETDNTRSKPRGMLEESTKEGEIDEKAPTKKKGKMSILG
jgi:hypothetical protein